MNKIFKVIWNHATQSWVATSELSRSKGKTKSKSLSTAKSALAAAIAVAATSGSAYAAMAVGGTGAAAGTTGNGVVTVVNGRAATAGTATVTGAARGMAIGENATVSYATTNAGLMDKTTSMAIGNNASVSDTMTGIAIGTDAKVHAANAIAIGNNATAIKNSTNSENNNIASVVVIGNDALVRNTKLSNSRGATAIGGNALSGLLTDAGAADGAAISLTSSDYGTATGCETTSASNPTIVTNAQKGLDGSIGVLWRAGITDVNGNALSGVTLQSNEGTAIGFDSRAIGDQSIAIGAQTISGHASVAIGGNDTYQVTSAAKQTYQTITGQTWGKDYETTYSKDGSVAVGVKSYANSSLSTALGTQAKVNANSTLGTAIGSGARVGYADGVSSNSTIAGVAIGAGSIAENNFTTAVGTGSNALAVNATALGYKALANATNATSVGAAAIAAADNALAYGANATSYAANAVAIGTNATVTSTGTSSIAFGTNTNVSGERSVALGNNITALSTHGSVVLGDSSTEVVTTQQTEADGTVKNVTAGTDGMTVTPVETVKSVTIGSGAAKLTYDGFAGQVKDAGQYVSVGRKDAERQIKNVAPGAITNVSTDAINGSQLYAALDVLGSQVGQIYFHVNNASTSQDVGDSATNLGKITDKAGAIGNYAVTAGVNTTSHQPGDVAMGYQAIANSTTNRLVDSAVAIGNSANATGASAIAIGMNATTGENFTTAIGAGANASGVSAVSIGHASSATGGATAIGYNATGAGGSALAMGIHSNASVSMTMALGGNSSASAFSAAAIGSFAKATQDYALAVGTAADASGTNGSVAIGWSAGTTGDSGVAVGPAAKSNGERAVALGRSVHANGTYSVGIGTGTAVRGDGSSTVGYSNVIGSTSSEVSAFGSKNLIGATATFDSPSGVGITNSTTIADTAAVTNSKVVGNNNYISSSNTYVLGSGVGVKDDGTSIMDTVENSVYLGNDSTITSSNATIDATTAGTVKNLNTNGDAGATSTAGSKGTVTEANVSGLVYGDFAGATSVGAVSVGASGSERRIVNMAAGEISATSTDAINGSQLYAVADILGNVANSTVAALGDNVTLNPNGTFSVSYNLTGTDPSNSTATETEYTSVGDALTALSTAVNQPLTFKGDEGTTTQELGSTLNIVAGNATDTSTRNVKTNVTAAGQLEISFSDKPSFTNITVDGNKTSPITIGADAAGNNYIANLTTTIPVPKTEVAAANKPTTNLTNAATLGDVLNAGWNLKENNTAKDVVTPYDTVNFVNGNGTTVNITTTDNVSVVKVDVNVSSLTGPVTNGTTNTNGTTTVAAGDENKLVNTTTLADAINSSGFNVKSGGNKATGDDAEATLINPGETVTFTAGKNLTVKRVDNEFTYATADKVEFTNVNVTSTLPTSPVSVGENGAKAPTNLLNLTTAEPKAVVTAKDLANYGWIVATPNNNYDAAVKNANYVNFIGDGGVVVKGKNNATTGSYDVVVKLEQAGSIKLETGNGTTVPTGKLEVKDNPTGFVTAQNVVDMVNNSGWNTNSTTATGGATNTLVNPGEQVNFEAGKNMVVTQDVNATTGTVSYTYATADDVTFNSTAIGGQDTYKDAAGNPVTKNEKGDFVDAAGNKIDPANVTTVNNSPITIGTTPEGKNVIANLTKTLPDTTSVGDNPTEKAPITAEEAQNIANTAGNNAATLGDVLNAGWNLKVNNEDVDFVKPYDTVAFVNGTGTTARVEYKDGVQSNITFDVNVDNKTTEITYADAEGNQVVKVGDKFYNPADLNEDGTPKADAKPVENVVSRISAIGPKVNGETVSGPINIVNGDTTTVTNTPDGVKVEVNTGASDVTDEGKATVTYTDKNGNPVTATTNPDGSVTYTDKDGKPVAAGDVVSSGDKVATVGDIVNTINNVGWFTNSTNVGGNTVGTAANTKVSAGKAVNFEAGLNMEVKQDVDKTGNVTYTYATKKEVTFDKVTADKGITLGAGDNAVNMTPTTTNVANGDISPAVNMNGATFTNMTSNLPNTTSVGDNPTTKAPLTAQEAQDLANKSGSNAATLGDVLNAGWNLQENGKEKDFVKPYDTVNFVNGVGTTANITTDGSVSNVTYNVNVDNQTTEITYTNKAGDTIYKLADGTYNTSPDGKGTAVAAGDISGSQVSAKTSPLTNNVDGTVNTPANPKALATAGDVANAINNSGFTLTTSASAGEVSGTSKELVKPGKTVTIDAGKNISVTQNAGTITVATKKDVEFDSVKAGPVTINSSGINAGGTKITNVAPGKDGTDAVNVNQLKQVAGDIHNKINRNNKDLRAGIAGANAAAGLPQVYIPGKSMVAASAGTFKGQSAVAVGYSRASDNGKLILKLQGNANTRGDIGGSVGVGYQW